MKIDFEGRTWEFDADELDVKQAMVLHLTYGMTIADWIRGLDELDPRALHFTYWLMLQQNGVVMPIAEANCKIVYFSAAMREAQLAEAAAAEPEPEPDPTSLSGGRPSREHSSRPATTRRPRDHGEAATGS